MTWRTSGSFHFRLPGLSQIATGWMPCARMMLINLQVSSSSRLLGESPAHEYHPTSPPLPLSGPSVMAKWNRFVSSVASLRSQRGFLAGGGSRGVGACRVQESTTQQRRGVTHMAILLFRISGAAHRLGNDCKALGLGLVSR